MSAATPAAPPGSDLSALVDGEASLQAATLPEATKAADRGDTALYTLLLVVFINIAGFGVVVPLLPFYGESFGAAAWQVTLLFSAYSLGNFFAEPFWGRVSDRIGRRPILILTIVGNCFTYLALAFAPNIWVAVGVRLVGGLLTGNLSVIQGYIADVTPPAQRAGKLGLLGGAFGLGFVAGPGIGGLLAQPDLGTIGFRLPLFLAAALCVFAAAGVLFFVRESRTHVSTESSRAGGRFENLEVARRSPVISRVLLVTVIGTAAFAAIESTFGLWAQARFRWGPQQIGLIFMLIGVVAATAQVTLTGRLARRYGEATMLTFGLCLTCVGLAMQIVVVDWRWAVFFMVLIAFGQSLALPNISALISRATPPDRQGAMLGLNLALGALARIIGPLFAGPLFTGVGPFAPFMAGALVVVVAIGMAYQAGHAVRLSRRRW